MLSPTLCISFNLFLYFFSCCLLFICQNLIKHAFLELQQFDCYSLKVSSEEHNHLLCFTQATERCSQQKSLLCLRTLEKYSRDSTCSPLTSWGRHIQGLMVPYLAGGTSILEETTFRFCSRRQMERVFSFSWSSARLAFLVSAVFASSSMAKGNKCWWDIFLLESRFKSSAWNVKVISRLMLPTCETKHKNSHSPKMSALHDYVQMPEDRLQTLLSLFILKIF